jgi:hypothetical protein
VTEWLHGLLAEKAASNHRTLSRELGVDRTRIQQFLYPILTALAKHAFKRIEYDLLVVNEQKFFFRSSLKLPGFFTLRSPPWRL